MPHPDPPQKHGFDKDHNLEGWVVPTPGRVISLRFFESGAAGNFTGPVNCNGRASWYTGHVASVPLPSTSRVSRVRPGILRFHLGHQVWQLFCLKSHGSLLATRMSQMRNEARADEFPNGLVGCQRSLPNL